MKLCFFHEYKTVTPSFMHLFVAKDHQETPASVPMFTGRECCKCGKRTLIRLQDKMPDLIEERAKQWQERHLEELDHGDQLMWFSKWNKFIFIKDLEEFLIDKLIRQNNVRKFVIIPIGEQDAEEREQQAQSRRAGFKLVVNKHETHEQTAYEA